MRKITKNLLRVLGVITVLVFTAVGVSAYNYHHYKRRGPDPRDSSVVAARGGVTPVSGTYMRGFYYPAHGAAHPGTVVVFKGSDGSNNDELARQVRDQGYNVLGLYFFGQPGQQQYLANVPLEFFDEVLAWINDHGDVQEPITVMGVSKGAELVANLAIRYPEIDNIVVFTPSAYTYQGLGDYRNGASSSFTPQRPSLGLGRGVLGGVGPLLGLYMVGLALPMSPAWRMLMPGAPASAYWGLVRKSPSRSIRC